MESSNFIKIKKTNPAVLISKDKLKYIVLEEKEHIQCISNFEFKNTVYPSLTIEMNRILRTHSLLKFLPGLITMSSDGIKIDIDSIVDDIKFKPEADISGIIQYKVLNHDPSKISDIIIFEEVVSIPTYNMSQIETSFHSNSLKIFPILLEIGALICIVDAVEKVLHCPIIDPSTGYIGSSSPSNYNKLMKLSTIWPELNLEFTTKNKMIYIFSKLIKEFISDDNGILTTPCIVKIHRNYGSDEVETKITHLLLENKMILML